MADVIRFEGRLMRVEQGGIGADAEVQRLSDEEFAAAFAAISDVFPDAVGDPIAKVVTIEMDIEVD